MNISTKQLALNLEEWVAEVAGFNAEPNKPARLSDALPLVLCSIISDARVASSTQVPGLGQYEQALVRVRTADLLLMVSPEPDWTADQALYDAVDILAAAIPNDQSLGGRVHVASKYYETSYDPPEAEYQDGTVARIATFRMYVGELVKEV